MSMAWCLVRSFPVLLPLSEELILQGIQCLDLEISSLHASRMAPIQPFQSPTRHLLPYTCSTDTNTRIAWRMHLIHTVHHRFHTQRTSTRKHKKARCLCGLVLHIWYVLHKHQPCDDYFLIPNMFPHWRHNHAADGLLCKIWRIISVRS